MEEETQGTKFQRERERVCRGPEPGDEGMLGE